MDKNARTRWTEEMTSAWLYGAVAEAEGDPRQRALFDALRTAAERQAAVIADGGSPPAFEPSRRARIVASLVRLFGRRRMLPVLAAMKIRGLSAYANRGLADGHAMPISVADVGRSHRGTGGGTLRAAVFGVNDGLVSNTCLIMGVAGAASDPSFILLSGVAGLLAGAFSMAAGEYISVRSQREMYEYQIAQEQDELARYPTEEAKELALIYAARGIPADDARRMARELVSRPSQALDTLAREELGLNPDDLGSPLGAALSSFAAFAIGATLPLAPFLFGLAVRGVPIAAGLAGIALFAIGAVLSLFSGRGAFAGGLRMLVIGAGAAVATYIIGTVFGASIG
jgi:VIT1/CCC1 family predicted Fe2+/Mn2+ transporter